MDESDIISYLARTVDEVLHSPNQDRESVIDALTKAISDVLPAPSDVLLAPSDVLLAPRYSIRFPELADDEKADRVLRMELIEYPIEFTFDITPPQA